MKNTVKLCRYCGEVFSKISELRFHEHRCMYNPEKRSCHSCAFYEDRLYKGKRYHYIYDVCLVNENISRNKPFFCRSYLNEKYRDDPDIMRHVKTNFNERLGQERALQHIDQTRLFSPEEPFPFD